MRAGSTILLLFAVFLLQTTGTAQSFAWKAELKTVPQSGFYRIPLSLDWLWRVKADLSDVRIHNDQGVVVPFLVQQPAVVGGTIFIDYPILRNTTDTFLTTMELDAGENQGTNRVDLIMGNTAVARQASLSGSNDRKQWFIIEESLQLVNTTSGANDRFVQSLRFPFVQYRYLKLQIRNKGTDPLPVIKAGLFVDTTVKPFPDMIPDPGTTYRQADSSDGHSYVGVHNRYAYPIDKIYLQLSGATFYQRNVQVYKTEKGRARELVTETELRSGSEPAIWLPALKAEDFFVRITNGDNPPLQITAVKTFTRQQVLIAFLEKGKHYLLVGGNKEVAFPQYDLAHFRDSIPISLPVLAYDQVIEHKGPPVTAAAIQRWWIWPAIVLMLLILTAVTLRMAREAGKEE